MTYPFQELAGHVHNALKAMQANGDLPSELDLSKVNVEPARDQKHGEAATNAAMVLAKQARIKPQIIAQKLCEQLEQLDLIESASAVGPGFVNLILKKSFWLKEIPAILTRQTDYGKVNLGKGQPVNVEYVSANPTGPLHVGHGRGTVFGDVMASLLDYTGFDVTREYYVNDGGAQIDLLAQSVYFRYREILGQEVGPLPDGLYPLKELIPIAQAIADKNGDVYLDQPEEKWLNYFGTMAVEAMLERIKEDLAALGVHQKVFSSEKALIEAGKVDQAVNALRDKGLVYIGELPPPKGKAVEDWEPEPLLLFRASQFGDDTDRPLKRSNGAWTYFANDIAYHYDKYQRGFKRQIDFWGADHAGHIKRMKAAVSALSEGEATLEVLTCQLVNLFDGGQPLKMSKRAGRILWLKDVVEETGADVFRFMMLTRKNDASLDFDLQKVLEHSKDNPVFYVQYAHARICSVLRNAQSENMATDAESLKKADLNLLKSPEELELIRFLSQFPRNIESAVVHCEPHRIAYYLNDLAGKFHVLWTKGKEAETMRFLQLENRQLSDARLSMLLAVKQILSSGLELMGVQPVEEMR